MATSLSDHFTLEEICKSQTASRLGINNLPTDPGIIENLSRVCVEILEPARAHYGVPFSPSSGYRCLELNRAIGSKDSSQHVKGEAVDFEVPGIANPDLADWIHANLGYDQLILEFYTPGTPNSGWVHCSVTASDNRKMALTINRQGTQSGLVA